MRLHRPTYRKLVIHKSTNVCNNIQFIGIHQFLYQNCNIHTIIVTCYFISHRCANSFADSNRRQKEEILRSPDYPMQIQQPPQYVSSLKLQSERILKKPEEDPNQLANEVAKTSLQPLSLRKKIQRQQRNPLSLRKRNLPNRRKKVKLENQTN